MKMPSCPNSEIEINAYANVHELSLQPPTVIPAPGKCYQTPQRSWQGIPTVERTPQGTLFSAWYTGDRGEGPGNYVVLSRSDNNGHTWDSPLLAVLPRKGCREFDPLLWIDPMHRLWLFWAQSYGLFNGRAGVWYIRTDKPEVTKPKWSTPARICDGVMINKPTVLSDESWLLPVSLWGASGPRLPELDEWRYPLAVTSCDRGESWGLRGKADVPASARTFDEHMVIERRDGSLWMLIRTLYGIGESVSTDHGWNWSLCRPSGLPGVDSRFFIRRSSTGRLLLVINNDSTMKRRNMTALVSEDEGQTWTGGLLLDERHSVSYPDGAEDGSGRWFIVYDRERNDCRVSNPQQPGAGEILLADFTEDEVLAGKLSKRTSRLKVSVDSLKKTKKA